MKVFVVSEIGVHGTGTVVGVYESREKAEKHEWDHHPLLYLSIVEMEVK